MALGHCLSPMSSHFSCKHLSVTYFVLFVQVRMGDVINEAQAEELLRQDLQVAELAVRRNVKVALTQNQFDALVSWTFNLGEGSLRDSTLLRLLNRGQTDAVPAQMKRWNKARVNGMLVPLPGLTARRNREAELWSKP